MEKLVVEITISGYKGMTADKVADALNYYFGSMVNINVTEAAQQSAQTDGLCLYPGCDDIGWNGGFCRLHNPANTPPAKSDPS